MSVSISMQFSGQIDGANHRKVISDIKTAIEVAMRMNGVDATLHATESRSVVTTSSFPDGKSSSTYPSNAITFSTGFHVNEDPVADPAPATSPAEAVAQAAPAASDTTENSSSSSAPGVESTGETSAPVYPTDPAPADPESSDGLIPAQA